MINEFKTYLQQVGYAPNTVQRYTSQVQRFLEYHCITDPRTVTPKHVSSFYEWLHIRPHQLKEGGISASHIANHIGSLNLFFSWLQRSGRVKANPVGVLSFRKGEKGTRQPLSREEVTALFEAAGSDKERALLHLLYSCGLRRTEAVMLDLGDVHFRARMLYVRRGKGCKRRAIPLTEKVADALELYCLTERMEAPIIKTWGHAGYRHPTAFLINKTGGRMQGGTYDDIMKVLKGKAGLEEKTVTPHYLRHSIATHLLAAGVPVEQVRDFLGHANLEATQLYTKVNTYQLSRL